MNKKDLLNSIRFGARIAEEELSDLEKYFVLTDQWNRVYSGEVDIIYGSKGSGKSAIYALLDKKQSELFDRNVIVKSAENIRGNTAFSDLISDPPPTERAFLSLWKLYFLVLSVAALREYGIVGKQSKELILMLEKAGLLPVDASLSQYFAQAKRYIWATLFPEKESVEWSLTIDPATGTPIATRKTNFKAKTKEPESSSQIPLDDLIAKADIAFNDSGYELWILFDRLDVAFNENSELERNALRALFRMYNDFKRFDSIQLKIFVRDDIWERISEGGFAEASHITKTVNIDWTHESLINLFVKRLLNNSEAAKYLSIDPDKIDDSFDSQKQILGRIFPDKVETGNNPETFRWMTNRIQDGTGKSAPRELIHLCETIRQQQLKRLERGEEEPTAELLFGRPVFKAALKEVSKARYEQTFLAENPKLKLYTEKLKRQKAEQTIESLSNLWETLPEDTEEIAENLVKAGFFEPRTNETHKTYWVPFLYRDALELVQGRATS